MGPGLHRIRCGRRARRAGRGRPGLAADPAGRRGRHHPQRLSGLHRRVDVRAEARLERCAGQLQLCRVCQRLAGTAERPRPYSGRLLRRRAGDRRRHHPEGGVRAGRRGTQERPRLAALPPDRRDEPGVLRAAGAPPDGPLRRDVRGLRASQGQELPARSAEPKCPLPQGILGRGRAGQSGGQRPVAAARHLRHLRRRGGIDRGQRGLRPQAPRLARRRAVGARGEHGDPAATRSICPNCRISQRIPPLWCPHPIGCSRTRSWTRPTPRRASGPRT